MLTTTFLAVTSGTGSTLLWLALGAIAFMAVVLYWPRRFSGPWTEIERQLAHRALRGRSLALTLATPLCTVGGLWLLLPPLVNLEVSSQVMSGSEGVPCEEARSSLSAIAWGESIRPWTESVLCRVQPGAGDEALAEAILAAAGDGFRRPKSCLPRDFSISEQVSVELSLVEIAARAFTLTRVNIDAGPRLDDPDPWDIMRRTLEARGIATCVTRAASAPGEAEILRLGRARFKNGLEVFAVVRGKKDDRFKGRLVSAAGKQLTECRLDFAKPAQSSKREAQRAVLLRVECPSPYDAESIKSGSLGHGLLLRAGHGETRIDVERPFHIEVEEEIKRRVEDAINITRSSEVFNEELKKRGLRPLATPQASADIVIEVEGGDLVIRDKVAHPGIPLQDVQGRAELNDGPFSWSGFLQRPEIECTGNRAVIRNAADMLDPNSDRHDPTAFYAVMSTITWAANVLTSGTCAEIRQPRANVSRGRSRPLLDATQIDEAVAAIRRGREALGLVLLGLAVFSLALGLRRSVR